MKVTVLKQRRGNKQARNHPAKKKTGVGGISPALRALMREKVMTWAVPAASWEEGDQLKPGPRKVGSDSPPAAAG